MMFKDLCKFLVAAGVKAQKKPISLGLFLLLVEPGRIELPSENAPRKASTGLDQVLLLAPRLAPERASLAPARMLSRDWLSRQRLFASLMGFATRIRLIRHPPHGCDDLGRHARVTYLTRQPLRSHNCHWQLCLCWVLTRTSQPLDLPLWPHHPRRNQGGPSQRTFKPFKSVITEDKGLG